MLLLVFYVDFFFFFGIFTLSSMKICNATYCGMKVGAPFKQGITYFEGSSFELLRCLNAHVVNENKEKNKTNTVLINIYKGAREKRHFRIFWKSYFF